MIFLGVLGLMLLGVCIYTALEYSEAATQLQFAETRCLALASENNELHNERVVANLRFATAYQALADLRDQNRDDPNYQVWSWKRAADTVAQLDRMK